LKRSMELFFFLSLGLITQKAFAWGKIGHEATSVIAYQLLSSTAKSKVNQLTGAQDLLEASLWADGIRSLSGWTHTKPFHFTQVQDHTTYYQSLGKATQDEVIQGDAIRALVKAEDTLRSASASKELKLYALKFIVHFIGDIHQPLHTGRPQDRGGNQVTIDWFGRKDNLHSVWDNGIIRARLEGSLMYRPEISEDLALYLSMLPRVSSSQVLSWQKGSFLEWHNESLSLRAHPYASVNMENEAVVEKYYRVIDQRIQMAGVRIAHLLNNIFESRALNAEGSDLRRQLASILGTEQSQDIWLEPTQGLMSDQEFSEFDCDHH
jgi:hypothetical protein